jgi:hypothetical protein
VWGRMGPLRRRRYRRRAMAQANCFPREERERLDSALTSTTSRCILATGYWLLATGYWLLATGYWLLATREGSNLSTKNDLPTISRASFKSLTTPAPIA